MSSYDLKTRFESQLFGMNRQTSSCGLSSAHLAGSGTMALINHLRVILLERGLVAPLFLVAIVPDSLYQL
jgi:hypothetical protein